MTPRPAHKRKPPAAADVTVFSSDEYPQGSAEWFGLRLGFPTSSVFAAIMADGRDGGESKTRAKLLNQLAGEILSGQPAEAFQNDAMRRGNMMEAEAVEHYAFTRRVRVERVGFVRRTIHNPLGEDLVVGCSPDGFVGDDGLLEVKTMRPDLLIELVDKGRFPTEHRAQVHGGLWVTGRKWCDLKVFYSGMPVSPTFRVERDDHYIAQIISAVQVFAFDLRRLVERVKAKGSVR